MSAESDMNTPVESSSKMLTRIQAKNPDKIYPPNMGKSWKSEEDAQLLAELKAGQTIPAIADKHGRTCGGITARCGEIAFMMYQANKSVPEIMADTRLDKTTLQEIIDRKLYNLQRREHEKQLKKQGNSSASASASASAPLASAITLDNVFAETLRLRSEIAELKTQIRKLTAVVESAIYSDEIDESKELLTTCK